MSALNNQLSKMLLTSLAMRRGLLIVSVENNVITVEPEDDAMDQPAIDQAIEVLSDEINRGRSAEHVVIKQVDSRK